MCSYAIETAPNPGRPQIEETKRLTLLWINDQEVYEGDNWIEVQALLACFRSDPGARKIELLMKSEL